ncbi:MAG: FHA domain-containing protein [Deltaproteobacteria bacterium]|nr:FHA domain-containing protein [Deltaproteobacteria bacterium]
MIRYRIIYQQSNIEAPEGRFDIGRSLDCNLVLDDPSVSRVHATIIRKKDQLLLEDRGSRNGCTLNGKQVSGMIPLKDGDVIGIGHQQVTISAAQKNDRVSSNTMGLMVCANCGAWAALGDEFCGQCGQSTSKSHTPTKEPPQSHSVTEPAISTDDTTLNSGDLLAGLAQKALGRNKVEEATILTQKLIESIARPNELNREPSDSELEIVAQLLIDLAVQSTRPELITELFALFSQLKRLLPRKAVDQLYAVAKSIGYRTSSDLHQYISCLSEISSRFSPGEKFIFRRIEGLVSLCN